MKTQKQQFIEHCDLIMDLSEQIRTASIHQISDGDDGKLLYELIKEKRQATQAFMKFFEEAVKKHTSKSN